MVPHAYFVKEKKVNGPFKEGVESVSLEGPPVTAALDDEEGYEVCRDI